MHKATLLHDRKICRHPMGWVAIAAICLAPELARAQKSSRFSEIAQQGRARLGLSGGEVVEIQPAAIASGGLTLTVPLGGAIRTIELFPFSIRSPNYSVLVQKADGTYEEAEPGPDNTFRGSVRELEGSSVAATFDENGLSGKIIQADGTRHWIEPVGEQAAGGGAGLHLIYRDEDVLSIGGGCIEQAADIVDDEPEGASAGTVEGLHVAQLAIDADYEYYLDYGSVAAVQTQIATVINAMNVQYERDVQIRHLIGTVIVRTAEPDPYGSALPETLLDQFRAQWTANHSGVVRDVAQLFTGRDLSGSTIGIAWVGQICAPLAYSVVESNSLYCDALACKTDLSAHELGHNWGAGHCDCLTPWPGWTMNAELTSSNRFHPTYSIPPIVSYRDTRSCLDVGDELLRVTISAPTSIAGIGEAVPLTATADFRYGPDQNVTNLAIWTVDRPEFAFVTGTGYLVVQDAEAESCLTVSVSYTADGITRTSQKKFTLVDPNKPLVLAGSTPPQGAIDGRRPTDVSGASVGWDSVDVTVNGEFCEASATRFAVRQEGGTQPAPTVAGVQAINSNTLRILLSRAIEPGAWTIIEDTTSDVSLRIGYLPGDVNGDATSGPSDILALVDVLNGEAQRPLSSADMDRSGAAMPADVLTLIDLLNGVAGSPAWNGKSLP